MLPRIGFFGTRANSKINKKNKIDESNIRPKWLGPKIFRSNESDNVEPVHGRVLVENQKKMYRANSNHGWGKKKVLNEY